MADDFRFLRISFCAYFTVSCVESLWVGQYQQLVTQGVTIIQIPLVCQASVVLQSLSRIVGSGEFSGRRAESFGFTAFDCVVHPAGASRAGSRPCDPGEGATGLLHRKAHSHFSHELGHHSFPELDCILRAITSPCSPPRSLGIGWTPSCSTQDRARCFHPATPACFGRRELAEFRTALHSINPKHFFRPH